MDFSFFGDILEEEAPAKAQVVGEGYRNILVITEAAGGRLLPASCQVLGQARELADQIGVYVFGTVLGAGIEALGDDLIAYGSDQALLVDDPALAEYQPHTFVAALAELVGRYRPEILLLSATPLGNDLAPRLAQRLQTGLLSNCTGLGLDLSERLLLGTFPALGGEIFHTAVCPEARPQMATLVPGRFRTPSAEPTRSGQVEKLDLALGATPSSARLVWKDLGVAADLPPVPLAKAKVIVAAGRGIGDAAGFARVRDLADALGGVVAGSRGALDEGWIGEQQMIGIGGELVAPDLYIACGLSGDIYHYFGAQKAKFIVAINTDEQAPIMKAAHLAVVGDARQVVEAMIEELGRGTASA